MDGALSAPSAAIAMIPLIRRTGSPAQRYFGHSPIVQGARQGLAASHLTPASSKLSQTLVEMIARPQALQSSLLRRRRQTAQYSRRGLFPRRDPFYVLYFNHLFWVTSLLRTEFYLASIEVNSAFILEEAFRPLKA
jgi:hypothetical protein